jgi:hypothetical protein
MEVQGEYRDVVRRRGRVVDPGRWRRNRISLDLGPFVASLLKKRFSVPLGIEYIAVGNGGDESAFKSRVASFFQSGNLNLPFVSGTEWAWAKKVTPEQIVYVDASGNKVLDESCTSRLQVETVFERGQPGVDALELREFALLARDPDRGELFLVDYVKHGTITKDQDMELTRTVKLNFPIGEGG